MSLRLPVNNRFSDSEVRLLDALEEFSEKDVHLLVKTGEQHNEYIRDRLPEHVQMYDIDDLHAKAVVCDEFVYIGSANITRGGLTLNRELCEVLENEYGSAVEYVEQKLGLNVDVQSMNHHGN